MMTISEDDNGKLDVKVHSQRFVWTKCFFKSVVSLSCQLAVRYSEQQSSPNCWNPTIFFCFWSGFDWILSCFLSQFASGNIRGPKCYVTVKWNDMRKQGSGYESKVGRNRVLTLRPLPPLLSRYLARGEEEQPRKIFGRKWKIFLFNLQGTPICPGGSGGEGNLSGKYLIGCEILGWGETGKEIIWCTNKNLFGKQIFQNKLCLHFLGRIWWCFCDLEQLLWHSALLECKLKSDTGTGTVAHHHRQIGTVGHHHYKSYWRS